jgi:hypothetical protein
LQTVVVQEMENKDEEEDVMGTDSDPVRAPPNN